MSAVKGGNTKDTACTWYAFMWENEATAVPQKHGCSSDRGSYSSDIEFLLLSKSSQNNSLQTTGAVLQGFPLNSQVMVILVACLLGDNVRRVGEIDAATLHRVRLAHFGRTVRE